MFGYISHDAKIRFREKLTRFVATIVSMLSGLSTILVVIASTNILSTVISGKSTATAFWI